MSTNKHPGIVNEKLFRHYFYMLIIMFFIVGCGAKQKSLDEISNLEKEMLNDSVSFNKERSEKILQLYTEFANEYPEHEKSSEYLFKAAEVANSLMISNEAIRLYNDFYQKYPDNSKAPICLFIQAFIYETQLNELNVAKEYYQNFLIKYPDHELAKDAKFSLENLGKSVEDLLKDFQQKNASADSSIS